MAVVVAVAVGGIIMTGEKRSVIKVGSKSEMMPIGDDGKRLEVTTTRSYQMTLPKWWCRKHSFPEHVYVEEMEDGALRVEAG